MNAVIEGSNPSAEIAPRHHSRSGLFIPELVANAGDHAARGYLEFFAAQIRNANTRAAYVRAADAFLSWSRDAGIATLVDIEPLHVAAWIERKAQTHAAPTVKLQLAGLRRLFDWLVVKGVLPHNPAAPVNGPKHSYTRGKTPILVTDEARHLLASIDTSTIAGLRDRALIALMTYTFARITAAISMNVGDVYPKQHRLFVRLHEKGGKEHELPCHHNLEQYLREYLDAAGIAGDRGSPLFRAMDRQTRQLSDTRLNRQRAYDMVRRRARQAGIDTPGICNHTFRGTGITAYLQNPEAKLEHAQEIAAHADPKTTRLYDRRCDAINLDEIERIGI